MCDGVVGVGMCGLVLLIVGICGGWGGVGD